MIVALWATMIIWTALWGLWSICHRHPPKHRLEVERAVVDR